MINIKKKIGIYALGAVLSFGTISTTVLLDKSVIVEAATSTSAQANSAISSLEASLKRNYLGSKNLPTFNYYLKNAKTLTNKLPNGSTKTAYNNRIAECERIIRATEAVVVLETSLDRNYHGMRNVPTFNAYLDKANKAISLINTNVCKLKLSDRTYLAFNIVRDIEVVNSKEYIAAANGFVESRKEYRTALKEQTKESKEKALKSAKSSLELVWKIRTSVAKDYLAKDIRSLINDINKIEVKEEIKEEVVNPKEDNKEEVTNKEEKNIEDKNSKEDENIVVEDGKSSEEALKNDETSKTLEKIGNITENKTNNDNINENGTINK